MTTTTPPSALLCKKNLIDMIQMNNRINLDFNLNRTTHLPHTPTTCSPNPQYPSLPIQSHRYPHVTLLYSTLHHSTLLYSTPHPNPSIHPSIHPSNAYTCIQHPPSIPVFLTTQDMHHGINAPSPPPHLQHPNQVPNTAPQTQQPATPNTKRAMLKIKINCIFFMR